MDTLSLVLIIILFSISWIIFHIFFKNIKEKDDPALRIAILIGICIGFALSAIISYHYPIPPPTNVTAPPPISVSDFLITEAFKNLPTGLIIFNPPLEMTKGVKERVEIRIANVTRISSYLTEGLKGRGIPQHEFVRVSNDMKVELKGDAFEINPLFIEPEQRIVDSYNYTEWAWDVTPLQPGDHNLSICVVAVIQGITDHYIDYPVMERVVHIRVDYNREFESFFIQEWKWILGIVATVLAASLGFIWRFVLEDLEREKIRIKLRTFPSRIKAKLKAFLNRILLKRKAK